MVSAMNHAERLLLIRRIEADSALEIVCGEPEMCLACNLGHDIAECQTMKTGMVTFESYEYRYEYSDRRTFKRPPAMQLNKRLSKWKLDDLKAEEAEGADAGEAGSEPTERSAVEEAATTINDSYHVTVVELPKQCKESWSLRDRTYDCDGEPVQGPRSGTRTD